MEKETHLPPSAMQRVRNESPLVNIKANRSDLPSAISMLLWNIEGYSGRMRKGPHNFENFDIVMLTETLSTTEISTTGRHWINKLASENRVGRPIYGISFGIKSSCNWEHDCKLKTDEVLAVSTNMLNVILCYFKPNTDVEYITEEIVQAFRKFSDLHDKPTLLCGDFSCRVDQPPRAKRLVKNLEKSSFQCLNDHSEHTYITRDGQGVIDLVFVNNGFADHFYSFVDKSDEFKHHSLCIEFSTDTKPSQLEDNFPTSKLNMHVCEDNSDDVRNKYPIFTYNKSARGYVQQSRSCKASRKRLFLPSFSPTTQKKRIFEKDSHTPLNKGKSSDCETKPRQPDRVPNKNVDGEKEIELWKTEIADYRIGTKSLSHKIFEQSFGAEIPI